MGRRLTPDRDAASTVFFALHDYKCQSSYSGVSDAGAATGAVVAAAQNQKSQKGSVEAWVAEMSALSRMMGRLVLDTKMA